jgi:23S rRNA (pseudouridine1915-N3)-methyltransferase
LKAIPPSAWVVALDERGERWGTADLARRLADWQRLGRDVALLVGGANGLDPRCLGRADQRWSLSPLTLPHALVRVILAEQIYRAQSLLDGHPYHRG